MMFALCDSGYSSPVYYSSLNSSTVHYLEVESPNTAIAKAAKHSPYVGCRRLLFRASPIVVTKVDAATQTSSGIIFTFCI